MAPLLTALAQLSPTPLQLHIHCQVDTPRLARKLGTLPWQHDRRSADIGIVQQDPMVADLPATVAALNEACRNWPALLKQECARIRAFAPDLVLADIPPLTLAAGAKLNVPTVALSSLSWDAIYASYFAQHPNLTQWLYPLQAAYASAHLALLPIPHMGGRRFSHTLEIPPIWEPGSARPQALRARLGIDAQDKRPLLLVSLGGIPSKNFPLTPLLKANDQHILLDLPHRPACPHLHGLAPLAHWPFADIMASVDGVVGKPGYNMAVETVAYNLPFFYAARGHFADEPPIEAWLARFGRAQAYTWQRLQQGAWLADWSTLQQRPAPAKPALNGAQVGARAILGLLAQRELRGPTTLHNAQ
ncbi:hypothetical protein [Magnetococcus marinus]|nr:hypothetical protein [Magnetococcus marinus]